MRFYFDALLQTQDEKGQAEYQIDGQVVVEAILPETEKVDNWWVSGFQVFRIQPTPQPTSGRRG